MSQSVDLPEKVWSALQQAANESGVSPAGWIAAHLPAPAESNGTCAPVEDQDADDLEPPAYVSVPLKRVGAVQMVCVAGRKVPPLEYPLENLSE